MNTTKEMDPALRSELYSVLDAPHRECEEVEPDPKDVRLVAHRLIFLAKAIERAD
jgi:hypothetical protein